MAIRCLGDQKQCIVVGSSAGPLGWIFFSYSAGWLTFSADFRLAAFFPRIFDQRLFFGEGDQIRRLDGPNPREREPEIYRSAIHTQSISSLPLLLSLQSPWSFPSLIWIYCNSRRYPLQYFCIWTTEKNVKQEYSLLLISIIWISDISK